MDDTLLNIAAEFEQDFEESPCQKGKHIYTIQYAVPRFWYTNKSNLGSSSTNENVPEKQKLSSKTNLLVNPKQRGNPLLKSILNVTWEYEDIVPDYQMGQTTCALFLSLRYHNLNPDYIHERLKQLGHLCQLRVLLVLVSY